MDHQDDTREVFAQLRRNLIDRQAGRLTGAAGAPTDAPTRRALVEVAAGCGPDTIDALVDLLRGLRALAPARVGTFPVVAFTRYGTAAGMRPVRGAAITVEGGRYNVHSAFYDEHSHRWEGQNGHYSLPWPTAWQELTRRAEQEPRP